MKTAKAIREEARRERFLNSRTRTIGVDVDALDAQVAEHKAQAAAKAAEDRAYAEYVAALNGMVEEGERAAMQDDIDNNVTLLANWRAQQDKTLNREWDLNDPERLKNDRPARVGDDDPRCGPSSMQQFDGEDLHKAEREQQLLEDQIAGIEAQLADHRAAKEAQEAESRAYAEYELALLHEVEVANLEAEREGLMERLRVVTENKMLARARRVREADEKMAAKRAEKDEVQLARESAFLTESRVMGYNFADPRRVRRDHYKGMTQEELAAIRAEQAAQRDELRARREAEQADDKAWADALAAQVEAAKAMERDAEEERLAGQREYYLALKAQQRAAKLAKRALAEERTNRIDNMYFDKFNQTSHN